MSLAALPCGQLALALTFGFAAAASLIVRHSLEPLTFDLRPIELPLAAAACARPTAHRIQLRPRATVRTGAELPLELTLSNGARAGRFRVALDAARGAVQPIGDPMEFELELAPHQVAARTVVVKVASSDPIAMTARMARLAPGHEDAPPAEARVMLTPLGTAPSRLTMRWEPDMARVAPAGPVERALLPGGERPVILRSGRR